MAGDEGIDPMSPQEGKECLPFVPGTAGRNRRGIPDQRNQVHEEIIREREQGICRITRKREIFVQFSQDRRHGIHRIGGLQKKTRVALIAVPMHQNDSIGIL